MAYNKFDDFEFRTRKVDLSKNNSSNFSRNYIEKNISNYNYQTFISKSFYKNSYGSITTKTYPKISLKPVSKVQHQKNTEVVVKLTSSSKNFKSISNHIDYITRNGEIEYFLSTPEYDKQSIEYKYGEEAGMYISKNIASSFRAEAKSFYKDCDADHGKKEKRETFNIVFSMKDYEGISEFGFNPQFVRQSAIKTIEKMYPDNFFVAALHLDTNNPHTHICLKAKNDKTGKRIDIKKNDLIQMRKIFAEELRKRGVEATATLKKDRHNPEAQKAKSQQLENSRNIYKSNNPFADQSFEKAFGLDPRSQALENGFFQITEIGKKKFKPDDKKESFFITYQTKDYKPITIWGKDLERLVKDNNLEEGSYAKFQKLGTYYEPSTRHARLQDNLIEITDYLANTKWDCITFDTSGCKANKSKFDPKLDKSKKPQSTSKFIKKLSEEELNARPNKLKPQRRYSKEEWARYKTSKIRRNPALCITDFADDIAKQPRNIADIPQHMRSVSDINMDAERSRGSNVLLHSDAQHNIPAQISKYNKELRPADKSDRGIDISKEQPRAVSSLAIKQDLPQSTNITPKRKNSSLDFGMEFNDININELKEIERYLETQNNPIKQEKIIRKDDSIKKKSDELER